MNTLPSELVKDVLLYMSNDDIIKCAVIWPHLPMCSDGSSDVWREAYQRYTDWDLPEGHTYKEMTLWWHSAPFRIAEHYLPGLKERVIRNATRRVLPLHNSVESILMLSPWESDIPVLLNRYQSDKGILQQYQSYATELYKYYPNEDVARRFAYETLSGRTYRKGDKDELDQILYSNDFNGTL